MVMVAAFLWMTKDGSRAKGNKAGGRTIAGVAVFDLQQPFFQMPKATTMTRMGITIIAAGEVKKNQ
jgi:hypothetical protein